MFVDLFAGGGNVGLNVKANNIIFNDIESDVVKLIECFAQNTYDYMHSEIHKIIEHYGLSDTSKYGYDHYGCNSSQGVAKVNKEGYLKLRDDYNNGKQDPVTFYTMLVFAFNNQIRFNSKGEFNMPVNKRDFNKNLQKNLARFMERLKEVDIRFTSNDFRRLDIKKLSISDFVYCDPPYLITNAAYNEQGGWNEDDESDLLLLLDNLNENKIRFALSNVLESKGKVNSILANWSQKYHIHDLNSNFANSNYQTKNRDRNSTREVLITNY